MSLRGDGISVKCLYCKEETRVVDSRDADDGTAVRRRRECGGCGERFTTYERAPLQVRKRDGGLEPFQREKLAAGVEKAFEKRPVAQDDLESLIDSIEKDVRSQRRPVVEAEWIGERVCTRIEQVDEVAYLRFASVYKDPSDTKEFVRELGLLEATVGEGSAGTSSRGDA